MSDTLVIERIESNLSRLRLPRIREILQGVIKRAEEHGRSKRGKEGEMAVIEAYRACDDF